MVNNNVVIEFPDEAVAVRWFNNEASRAILPISHEASASANSRRSGVGDPFGDGGADLVGAVFL